MHSSEGETGEHHAVSLDCTPAPLDIKWPKAINTCVCKRRFVGHKAVLREVCHLLLSELSISPVSHGALTDYLSDGRIGLWDPILAS